MNKEYRRKKAGDARDPPCIGRNPMFTRVVGRLLVCAFLFCLVSCTVCARMFHVGLVNIC